MVRYIHSPRGSKVSVVRYIHSPRGSSVVSAFIHLEVADWEVPSEIQSEGWYSENRGSADKL